MSIFNTIVSAIFGSAKAQGVPPPAGAPPSAAAEATKGAPPTATPLSNVDVAAVLNGLAAKSREKLDWKRSIVDLMKLLELDSSIAARKQLAKELHYSGNMDDSAAMNVWLHQRVMQMLAESGGKVPEELRH
jgi:Domain of unknown function (DUF3597)